MQDLFTMVNYLPRLPSEIDTDIFVKRGVTAAKFLHVRRGVVQQIIKVLEAINPAYHQLMEDPRQSEMRQKRQEILPINGPLEGVEKRELTDDLISQGRGPTKVQENNDVAPEDQVMSTSYIPYPETEEDKKQSFQVFLNKGTAQVDCHKLDKIGVSEFNEHLL